MSLIGASNGLFSEPKYHETELRICRGLVAENVLELPGSLSSSQIRPALERAQNIYHNRNKKEVSCSINENLIPQHSISAIHLKDSPIKNCTDSFETKRKRRFLRRNNTLTTFPKLAKGGYTDFHIDSIFNSCSLYRNPSTSKIEENKRTNSFSNETLQKPTKKISNGLKTTGIVNLVGSLTPPKLEILLENAQDAFQSKSVYSKHISTSIFSKLRIDATTPMKIKKIHGLTEPSPETSPSKFPPKTISIDEGVETILNISSKFQNRSSKREFVSKTFKESEKLCVGISLRPSKNDVKIVTNGNCEEIMHSNKTKNSLNSETIERLLNLIHGEEDFLTETDSALIEANSNDNSSRFELVDVSNTNPKFYSYDDLSSESEEEETICSNIRENVYFSKSTSTYENISLAIPLKKFIRTSKTIPIKCGKALNKELVSFPPWKLIKLDLDKKESEEIEIFNKNTKMMLKRPLNGEFKKLKDESAENDFIERSPMYFDNAYLMDPRLQKSNNYFYKNIRSDFPNNFLNLVQNNSNLKNLQGFSYENFLEDNLENLPDNLGISVEDNSQLIGDSVSHTNPSGKNALSPETQKKKNQIVDIKDEDSKFNASVEPSKKLPINPPKPNKQLISIKKPSKRKKILEKNFFTDSRGSLKFYPFKNSKWIQMKDVFFEEINSRPIETPIKINSFEIRSPLKVQPQNNFSANFTGKIQTNSSIPPPVQNYTEFDIESIPLPPSPPPNTNVSYNSEDVEKLLDLLHG